MSHARSQHPNAVLTPMGRRRMVVCVLNDGWTIEATAQRFQVDAKTVRKWRDRFVADGLDGLQDRSSRPHRSPNQTSLTVQGHGVALRRRHRWGADPIGHELELGETKFDPAACFWAWRARIRGLVTTPWVSIRR